MKPYGREKYITGGTAWKKDYHLHKNGKKIKNWWETIVDCLPRCLMKQTIKKEVEYLKK